MKDFAMQKPSDRWMMHQKEESVKEENAGGSKDATKDTKEPKEWKLKLLQGHEEYFFAFIMFFDNFINSCDTYEN
jgi:hypothetical protein